MKRRNYRKIEVCYAIRMTWNLVVGSLNSSCLLLNSPCLLLLVIRNPSDCALCIVHWIAFVCLSVGFYFYLHLTQSLAIQKSHFISYQMNKMFRAFKIHLNRLFIMHCTYWAVNVCFGCCFVSATQNKYFLPAPIHTCGESDSFYLLWCISLLSLATVNFIVFFSFGTGI